MPGLIADATFSGHLAARSYEADETEIETGKFMREMPSLPPTANF
jgi:dimethylamine/trimethylamine dehydrogenase